MSKTTLGSDPIYRVMYSFPEMVEDLLRSVFPAEALAEAELDSLRQLPSSYVGRHFQKREGDAVWRAPLRVGGERGRWLYVLVLLEFQSTDDETMALRVLEYTALLYGELLRRREAKVGQLPPVLPVVLYNGEQPWRSAREMAELIVPVGPELARYQPSQRYALLDERHVAADDMQLRQLTRAVVLLEQSRTPADLLRLAQRLKEWLASPGRGELKRAFANWLWALSQRLEGADLEPDGDEPSVPPELTLEEVTMTLEERVSHWRDEWIHHGMEQGIQRGMEQGIQRGMEQGIRQGLEHERTLLRRLAEAQFGAETAERLSAWLRQEDDPQRLEEMAEEIVRCETGDELLRRMAPAARKKPAGAD